MSAPLSPVRRRSAAGVLAMLSCAAVLTLSACDTSGESAPSGGGSGGHESGHTEHSGTPHPSSTHHTAPTSRPSEYNPANCPTGLVCSTPTP
ncbi:hypothetical protein EV188_103232 [Actinomycetospora succinea]|uniref:Lipoprotein n=1 Tax=Actinomycetospora succinea TaxID=663603 RepID=A0A4R6VGZ6_9PSEU|nr:hypothetical protein [Actinomycetospora succinea]TDQ60730.1 hypothetical protein EV188_103232 [Actinomycetospora succinea]